MASLIIVDDFMAAFMSSDVAEILLHDRFSYHHNIS